MPSWNGDPAKWRDYKQEVKLWKLSENLEVSRCLASTLVLKLTSTARAAALNMDENELHPAGNDAIEDAAEKGYVNITGNVY